jgi:serine/threonine protein kinase
MKPLQTLGKYELLEKIGAGGMAEVFKARQTGVEGFEKLVVVKKILPGYARNDSFIQMLVDEAKLTSVLQHPNIVQIVELDNVEKQYYMVMEYVDGRDLLKILAKCAERKLAPPLEMATYVCVEACKGLDYAHRARDIYGNPLNIIHRDVSPSNVIVSWSGMVKVMDFGVAKARTQDTKGSKHVLRGKLGYMSPEQVRGEEIDHRSDIFSLGIVLFESLTLKRLFLGRTDLETLINIRDADIEKKFEKYPAIDEPMRGILRKALARDREQRFSSAMELHDAVSDYMFQKGLRVNIVRAETFLRELFGSEATASTLKQAGEAGDVADDGEGPAATSSTLVCRPGPSTSPDVSRSSSEERRSAPAQAAGQSQTTPPPESRGRVAVVAPKTPRPAPTPPPTPTPTPKPIPVSTDKASPTSAPRPRVAATPTPAPAPRPFPSPAPDAAGEFERETSSPRFGEEPSPIPPGLKGHEFTLKNTSGFVFGPVDYANLVNMLQTGAISEEEFVSIDGGDFRRVKEVSAVRVLSPNQALKHKGVLPIYSGTLSRSGLVKVFYKVVSRALSGKLRFVAGSAQKEFFFRKGKPRHISSNLKQELLGPFLLQRRVITEEQMKMALDKAGEFGGRVGDSLVSLGYVKPHELYWLLDQQFREKFLQVFSWTSGSYEFYEGIPCPIDMAPSDANVYRFMLEGIRRHFRTDEMEGLYKLHAGTPIKTVRNQYVALDSLPLTSRELRLWAQVQRQGTFGPVLKENAGEETKESLYHLLLILHQLELIEFSPGASKESGRR